MRRGVLRAGLAALLFGASTPFAAQLARDVNPFTLAGLLYLGAALAVLPGAVSRRPDPAALRRGAPRLALAVVVGGAAGPVLLALGLQHASAANASLLLNLELVFTVVLASVVFREHIGPRVAAGTLLVGAASLVLAGPGATDGLRLGALLIAAACVCWAIDNSVTAELDELAPVHITFAKGLVAGTANTVIGLTAAPAPTAGVVGAALLIGALGYGLSITLWVAGARDLGAARAQVVFATAPFLGAVVAWTVLREPVRMPTVVALLLAAVGVALVSRSDHAHEHRHEATVHDHEHTHDDGHHDHVHADGFTGRHQHPHGHGAVRHSHPHVPDLHHRHVH
ncbi:membrane protein [Actinotalea ferrariae CF5-4]|uniref:Membrane protein n=1 Tax=Actinotalea ferrariae CF5-4 TaxID=948458 RepID=A0A021VZL8_9CELL|nr:DMT family transporter [Actinotalea ferrariae]EYR64512.1 membrane protein [Actinotalea ferrariae CF5-4]